MLCWMTQRDTLSLVEGNMYKVWKVILDHWFTTATELPLTVWYCTSLAHYFFTLFNMWLKIADCSISSPSCHVQSEAVIPDVIRSVNLTGWLQTCQTFQLEMAMKINGYSLTAENEAGSKSKWPLDGAKVTASALCLLGAYWNLIILTFSDACLDVFHKWMVKNRRTLNSQCGVWEETAPRRKQAVKLAKFLAHKHGKTISSAKNISLHSTFLFLKYEHNFRNK